MQGPFLFMAREVENEGRLQEANVSILGPTEVLRIPCHRSVLLMLDTQNMW